MSDDNKVNPALEKHIWDLTGRIIHEKGWTTFRDIDIQFMDSISAMGAHLSTDDRRIHIQVGKDLYEAVDALCVSERLDEERDAAIEKIIYMALGHEHGHHQHCPATKEDMQKILAGSFEAIQGKEFNEDRIKALCFMIHNIFSDTILNTVNAHTDNKREIYRQGLDRFFLLAWNYMKRKFKQRGDKSINLHINLNQLMCDTDPEMQHRMKKYMPRMFLGFKRYRGKLLDVFTGDEALSKTVLQGSISEQASHDLVSRIQDRSLWKQMAFDYTTIMYPFMKQDHNMGCGNSQPYQEGQPAEQQEGDGQQQPRECKGKGTGTGQRNRQKKSGSGKDDKGKQGGGGKEDKKDKDASSSGGNKDRDDKDSKVHVPSPVDDFFRKMIAEHAGSEYRSPYLKHLARLDQLYRQRAKRVALIAEDPSMETPQHELDLSREEMPLGQFSSRKIDWGSTRLLRRPDGTRYVQLYRRSVPVILPFESQESPGGLPDLSFIFDSSISMNFKPFEGDGVGEYHLAALTVYSILEDLERKGIAPLLRYHMINFSNKTTSSDWRTYNEMWKFKEALFDYQGGGTVLNPKALADLRKSRQDNFISFILTDGGFNYQDNQKNVLKEFEEMARTGGIGMVLFALNQPVYAGGFGWGGGPSSATSTDGNPDAGRRSTDGNPDAGRRSTDGNPDAGNAPDNSPPKDFNLDENATAAEGDIQNAQFYKGSFAYEMQQLGATVIPINKVEDFMNLSIQFSRDLYGKVVRK